MPVYIPAMSNPGSLRLQRSKQRADVACDFCRYRKLGCDNARPKCKSCTTHGRECKYTARVTKERYLVALWLCRSSGS
ncbi:hypothetical protein HDV63DRAFT_280824 [Trichoderma sp. SZMC 28014]